MTTDQLDRIRHAHRMIRELDPKEDWLSCVDVAADTLGGIIAEVEADIERTIPTDLPDNVIPLRGSFV